MRDGKITRKEQNGQKTGMRFFIKLLALLYLFFLNVSLLTTLTKASFHDVVNMEGNLSADVSFSDQEDAEHEQESREVDSHDPYSEENKEIDEDEKEADSNSGDDRVDEETESESGEDSNQSTNLENIEEQESPPNDPKSSDEGANPSSTDSTSKPEATSKPDSKDLNSTSNSEDSLPDDSKSTWDTEVDNEDLSLEHNNK